MNQPQTRTLDINQLKSMIGQWRNQTQIAAREAGNSGNQMADIIGLKQKCIIAYTRTIPELLNNLEVCCDGLLQLQGQLNTLIKRERQDKKHYQLYDAAERIRSLVWAVDEQQAKEVYGLWPKLCPGCEFCQTEK